MNNAADASTVETEGERDTTRLDDIFRLTVDRTGRRVIRLVHEIPGGVEHVRNRAELDAIIERLSNQSNHQTRAQSRTQRMTRIAERPRCNKCGFRHLPENPCPFGSASSDTPAADTKREAKSPFECQNCGHKPTPQEVTDRSGECVKCGDVIIAYTVDAAESLATLRDQLTQAQRQIEMDTECIERIREHGMRMEIEASQVQAANKLKDEALAMAVNAGEALVTMVRTLEDASGQFISSCHFHQAKRNTEQAKTALAIQPDASALQQVIKQKTARLQDLLKRARRNVEHSASHEAGAVSRQLLKEIDQVLE